VIGCVYVLGDELGGCDGLSCLPSKSIVSEPKFSNREKPAFP